MAQAGSDGGKEVEYKFVVVDLGSSALGSSPATGSVLSGGCFPKCFSGRLKTT